MIKLIVFDWDDVFTRGASEGYYACYKAGTDSVLDGIDPNAARAAAKELWGRPAREVIARILGKRSDLIEQAHEHYEKCLFSELFIGKLSIVPDSIETLHALQSKYKLAIATGIHPVLLKEYVMPKFGVSKELFCQIISTYDLPDLSRGKPYPDLLENILKTQDVRPDEAIMAGDAAGDVKMAQASGVRPVVVLTGHLSEKQAQELGVKDVVPTVADIESVLG
ncbi:HAD family hydrolase [Candidatus Kaiserbacteria bacterium]|nr:HAD family hydrolase [Candidatus Kaiserbacteria bacterium]